MRWRWRLSYLAYRMAHGWVALEGWSWGPGGRVCCNLAADAAAVEGTPLTAPMPGMIVKYEKKEGDSVSQGETVVVLEAMKMENALPAPASGTVKSVNFSSGDSVAKGDVLAVIG